MIKEDLANGQLVDGRGRIYKFDSALYLRAVKFLMKKFNITNERARGQLNFYIVRAFVSRNGKIEAQYLNDKKSTNARLKNIIELDYEWDELFN